LQRGVVHVGIVNGAIHIRCELRTCVDDRRGATLGCDKLEKIRCVGGQTGNRGWKRQINEGVVFFVAMVPMATVGAAVLLPEPRSLKHVPSARTKTYLAMCSLTGVALWEYDGFVDCQIVAAIA
jgi:hypothetical protein